MLYCKFKAKLNNSFCELVKPNILRLLQSLGLLSDDSLSSLGTHFLPVVLGYHYILLVNDATGFSITVLILDHSLEMRAAGFF